jgi:peptidoglycan L-alanyl-D-glutamate endopeptidase CwlK
MQENYRLGKRSLETLRPVHPDLYAVVRLAIRLTRQDFMVFEGLRSVSRQKQLLEDGKSKTLKSRHLTGHAVDLPQFVSGEVVWDPELSLIVKEAMFEAGEILGVPLRWGGDWDRDRRELEPGEDDLVHFELPREDYPA